jgi:hypothetical protein
MNMNKIKIMMIILLVTVLVISPNIHALGVAPSRDIIDFKLGKQTLTARIINSEKIDMRLALYAKGELANYTTISDSQIVVKADEAEKTFTYTLDLPATLTPGTRELGIVIVQLPDTFVESDNNLVTKDGTSVLFNKKEKNSMVSATSAVSHQLLVRVPYPDSYLEGSMYISEGKVGDTLTFTMPVVNRGSKSVEVYADITIKGPTNEEIATFKTDKTSLEGSKETSLIGTWKADVNQGLYYAEAVIHYGDKYIVVRKEFMIGNLFISVEDLSVQGFKLGGIAKFDVNLKNKWNQDIKDVYGELNVLDQEGKGLATVKTLSTDLPGYGDGTINGYWDTTGVEVGKYDVNVVLHYAGKTTEKLFQTVVGIDKITVGQPGTGQVTGAKGTSSGIIPILVVVVAVLIVVNMGWFLFLRKKFQKPPQT